MKNKQHISLLPLNTSIGFIYWLNEANDLRGLRNTPIQDYPTKLEELHTKYVKKYPSGLTGWSNPNY